MLITKGDDGKGGRSSARSACPRLCCPLLSWRWSGASIGKTTKLGHDNRPRKQNLCISFFFFWSAGEVDTPSHLQTKREQFGFDKYILKQFWHCEDLQCSAGWWWGLIQLYSPLLSQGHLKTRPGVTTSSCYELLATLQGFNTILREAILQVPKVRWLHHVRLCV